MLPGFVFACSLLCSALPVLSRATNAERLAASLPPLKPRHLYGSRTRRDGAQPSPLPPLPLLYGSIEILNATRSHMGYLGVAPRELSFFEDPSVRGFLARTASQATHFHYQPLHTAGPVELRYASPTTAAEAYLALHLLDDIRADPTAQIWGTGEADFDESDHPIHPQPDFFWEGQDDAPRETQVWAIDPLASSVEVWWDNAAYWGSDEIPPQVQFFPIFCTSLETGYENIWAHFDPDEWAAYVSEYFNCQKVIFQWTTVSSS